MIGNRPFYTAPAAILLDACGGGSRRPPTPVVCKQQLQASRPISTDRCGPAEDYKPVNSYQGQLAPVVQQREDAVALIEGSCTGTLIAAAAGPVVLTAGHCVRLGDRPLVVFNFEDAPDGDQLITEGTVIEQATTPDYALIQLDHLPAVTPTPLALEPSDRLVIIQHPRGRPKVAAEGTFFASCNGLLYYVGLDTDVGSSGAGLLN